MLRLQTETEQEKKKEKEKVLGLLNRGPHLKWADKRTANISATVTFKFLAKNEDQHPTNDSSGGFVSGLCLLSPLAVSPTWLEETLEVGRERSAPREKVGPPRVLAPPHPPPAGGFPGLNGMAGELDRGSGCQLPRLGGGLREKTRKASEKVWGGDTQSQHPRLGKHEGGGGKGEWRGAQGYPLFAGTGRGGVRKSTHAQKEREAERAESERKTDQAGGDGVGPGDPLTPRRGPRPGAPRPSGPRSPAARRPPFSGPRAVTAAGLLPSPPGRERRVCACACVRWGGPGVTPRPAFSPAPREAASFPLSSPAPPGRAGGKTKGD